jgi:hypothetical protein
MKNFGLLVVILVATVLGVSNASDQIGAGTAADPAWYFGTPQYMGNGAFKTYVVIDHENEMPIALGCEFSKAFLFDPPFEVMMTGMPMSHIDLQFPDITTAYTPFQSYESNWMPLGHPNSPYAVAHIDFHFYLVSEDKRATWTDGNCGVDGVSAQTFCKGVTPIPAPCCPPTYVLPGLVSPKMGSHMVSFLDPALSGQRFAQTFIFGTMEGRIIFYEPMITIEFFEKVQNASTPSCFPISNPSHQPQGGMYPTQYCIYTTNNNFRVELNQFAFISGGCGTVEQHGAATCAYDASTDTGITMNAVKNCNSCPYYKYTKEMAKDA